MLRHFSICLVVLAFTLPAAAAAAAPPPTETTAAHLLHGLYGDGGSPRPARLSMLSAAPTFSVVGPERRFGLEVSIALLEHLALQSSLGTSLRPDPAMPQEQHEPRAHLAWLLRPQAELTHSADGVWALQAGIGVERGQLDTGKPRLSQSVIAAGWWWRHELSVSYGHASGLLVGTRAGLRGVLPGHCDVVDSAALPTACVEPSQERVRWAVPHVTWFVGWGFGHAPR